MSTTFHKDAPAVERGEDQRTVTMRICGPADERALHRLAELDSARALEGTVLAAEIDDEPLAAISLETGRVVADPFCHTAALVDLLRARAVQLQVARVTPARRLSRVRAWLLRPTPGTNP